MNLIRAVLVPVKLLKDIRPLFQYMYLLKEFFKNYMDFYMSFKSLEK